MIDVRCEGTMHARLDPDRGTIEFKCGRRRCGASRDVVVLHTFSITTGAMVNTRRFRNPPREEDEDGTG